MQLLAGVAQATRKAWSYLTGENTVAVDAYAHVFEDNFDGLAIIGEDGRIMAASQVATHLLIGPGHGTIVGRLAAEVLPKAILSAVHQAFADGRRAVPSPMTPAVLGDPERGGHIVQFVVTLSEIGQNTGLLRRVVCLTFWDETDRRLREKELAFVGARDPLTGAVTREELLKAMTAELATDSRSGIAVFVIDLNRFKAVNAILGHAFGDMLLKQVVGRLKAAGFDTVARLGGDTFGILLPGRLSAEALQRLCASILDRIVLPYDLGEHHAVIGASMGVTHSDISGADAAVLLDHAELALSVAKEVPGSNAKCFDAEMDQRLKQRQDMDLALRAALERGEFSVIYQPQCKLDTGELVGVEALVRWEHPTLGVIPPDRFIAAAEENGAILELGRWILQTACREVASWPFQTRLAVNLSPVQFELRDMVSEVAQALLQSGLSAQRLDVEITERILVPQGGTTGEALRRLQEMGVGVVLDDFCTGYSSLGYLARLPIDKIKIARDFVSGLPVDTKALAIVRAVMTLSETLGKTVIAEGVETADQVWMLRVSGCSVGQGHYFGLPRTSTQMARWADPPPSAGSLAG